MELLAVIGALTLIPLTSILNGWVLTKLWAWFIVPTFDAPMLSIVPAIGLSIIVGYLTQHVSKSESEDGKYKSSGQKLAEAFFKALLNPLVYLLIGWIVSWFM